MLCQYYVHFQAVEAFMRRLEGLSLELQRHCPEDGDNDPINTDNNNDNNSANYYY